MSVFKAVLIGHLLITAPIFGTTLIFAGLGLVAAMVLVDVIPGLPFLPMGLTLSLLAVLVGAGIGWLWWSFLVPRWRKWAHQRGADPARLQKWAAATGLVWPKGSIFEKTEFKVE